MTKKRYDELLDTKRPFIYNANEASMTVFLAAAAPELRDLLQRVFTTGKDVSPRKPKSPLEQIYEGQITPREANLLSLMIGIGRTAPDNPIIRSLEGLVERLNGVVNEYHPDSIRERESQEKREAREAKKTAESAGRESK